MYLLCLTGLEKIHRPSNHFKLFCYCIHTKHHTNAHTYTQRNAQTDKSEHEPATVACLWKYLVCSAESGLSYILLIIILHFYPRPALSLKIVQLVKSTNWPCIHRSVMPSSNTWSQRRAAKISRETASSIRPQAWTCG